MFKFLILAFATWALAASQRSEFDYFYDYIDAPADLQQPQQIQPLARPSPVQQQARPPPVQQQARARPPPPPRARPQPSRQQPSRPLAQQVVRGEPLLDGPRTTPVPILIDSRRIDTKTGAFVYQYAGADGSEKHEYRYPNGTVVGNYTFINDLGEKETRVYTAGVQDPNHIDETTDPNYVDLGNYDLYKHLEQPYIHNDGFSGNRNAPPSAVPQSRPRAQSRPARPAAPRPAPPRPVAPRPAPVHLDFNDAAVQFEQRPNAGPVFDYEDLPLAAAAPVAPAPPAIRRPPPPQRGSSSRGRAGGRPTGQAVPRPPHRLDFSGQSSDSFLDSVIRRFQ